MVEKIKKLIEDLNSQDWRTRDRAQAVVVAYHITNDGNPDSYPLHIAAKLLAQNAVAALTIGSPILFSSVAHGSAHDIAGKGVADAKAMIEAVLRLSKVRESRGLQPA
jgi:4-hydroxy-L-threonine phosphate dehydrogenase PdxA